MCRPRAGSTKRSALALALVAMIAAPCGCKGFEPLSDSALADAYNADGDGGGGGDSDGPTVPPQCTSTTVRAFQPLGDATIDSVRAALVGVGKNVAMVWESVSSGGQGTLFYAEVEPLGKVVVGPKQLGAGTYPHIVVAGARHMLFYRDSSDRLIVRELGDGGKLLSNKTGAPNVLVGWSAGGKRPRRAQKRSSVRFAGAASMRTA